MSHEDRIENLSRQFHIMYEANASRVGWYTQPTSRLAWEDLPEANRRATRMTVGEVVGPELKKIDRLRERVAELESAIRTVQREHQPERQGAGLNWCRICAPQEGSWPCLVRLELDAALPLEEQQG